MHGALSSKWFSKRVTIFDKELLKAGMPIAIPA
jgi:hypothetical protein